MERNWKVKLLFWKKKEKLLNEEELLDKVKFAMDNNSSILIKYILYIEK